MRRRTDDVAEVGRPEQDLGELYEAHAVWALRLSYVLTGDRELAEDLMQEAFIRAFDRLDALREQEAFPGYLRTTILNLARGHFRRQRIERLATRRHAVLTGKGHALLPDAGDRDCLWQALDSLPFRQRAALVLRYYEDLAERDAARALGTSVSGVKALVSRGTKTLRTELERWRGDQG